jgi:hypothetical protein
MSRTIGAACILCGLILLLMCGMALAQEEPPPLPPVSEEQPEMPAIHVYFYLNGELTPVEREVPGGGQMVEFTVIELLEGPSEEEAAAGYVTSIPEGVKLQYSTVTNDRTEYTLCLSRELLVLKDDQEGATKALAQIEATAKEASGAERIGITVAAEGTGGQPEDAYTALGVSQDQGQDKESEDSGINIGVLILVIVLGIALGASLLLLFRYLSKKREEVKKPARSGSGKKNTSKSSKSKKSKKPKKTTKSKESTKLGKHEKSKKRSKE